MKEQLYGNTNRQNSTKQKQIHEYTNKKMNTAKLIDK